MIDLMVFILPLACFTFNRKEMTGELPVKIDFIPLDPQCDEHLLNMIRWANDEELRPLIRPMRSKEASQQLETLEQAKDDLQKYPEWTSGKYMIVDGDKLIGDLSIQIDPGHLFKNDEKTSWLSITIGDKSYWGKGVAQMGMDFIEQESLKKGAVRMELGTFEFNHRAQAFYNKVGFKEIGRLENFTYWDGKFWSDIRMEKYLSQ